MQCGAGVADQAGNTVIETGGKNKKAKNIEINYFLVPTHLQVAYRKSHVSKCPVIIRLQNVNTKSMLQQVSNSRTQDGVTRINEGFAISQRKRKTTTEKRG